MNTNLLTKSEKLQAGLTKSLASARKSNADVQRFRRALAEATSNIDKQRKATLGALVLRAVTVQPETLPGLRNLLLPYVTRQTDWDALSSTPFRREVGHDAP